MILSDKAQNLIEVFDCAAQELCYQQIRNVKKDYKTTKQIHDKAKSDLEYYIASLENQIGV